MKKAVSFFFLATTSVAFGTDCKTTELVRWARGLKTIRPLVENCTNTLPISDTNVDLNGPDGMIIVDEMCSSDECKYLMQELNGVVDSVPDCAASISYKDFVGLANDKIVEQWNEACLDNQVGTRHLLFKSTPACTDEQVQNINNVFGKGPEWNVALSTCTEAANITEFDVTDKAVCNITECKEFVEFIVDNLNDLPDCALSLNPKELATKTYDKGVENWGKTCGEPPFSTAMTNTLGFLRTLTFSVSVFFATWIWL